MISADQSIIDYLNKDSRILKARLVDEDMGELAGHIRSLSIHKGSCSNCSFQPASIFSNYVDVKISEYPLDQKLPDEKIFVQIGCPINGEVLWTTVATVYVVKPVKKIKTLTFTGEGAISAKMGRKFKSGSYSTVGDLINAISQITGVSITIDDDNLAGLSDMALPSGVKYGDYYIRELLGYIAGLGFGYATETSSGEVVIRSYKYNDKIINTSLSRMRTHPDFFDATTPTGIEIRGLEDKQFITGDLQNVSLTNPLMTEEIFETYKDNFLDITYQPFDMNISLGNFLIEPTDLISIVDIDNVSHTVIPMSITHKFTGGLTTTLKAPTLDSGEDYSRVTTSMESDIAFNRIQSGNIDIPSIPETTKDVVYVDLADNQSSKYQCYLEIRHGCFVIGFFPGGYLKDTIPAKYKPAFPVTVYPATNVSCAAFTLLPETYISKSNGKEYVNYTVSKNTYISPKDPYGEDWGTLKWQYWDDYTADEKADALAKRMTIFWILADKLEELVKAGEEYNDSSGGNS